MCSSPPRDKVRVSKLVLVGSKLDPCVMIGGSAGRFEPDGCDTWAVMSMGKCAWLEGVSVKGVPVLLPPKDDGTNGGVSGCHTPEIAGWFKLAPARDRLGTVICLGGSASNGFCDWLEKRRGYGREEPYETESTNAYNR